MSPPKKRKSNSTKKAKEERLCAEAAKKREFQDKYDRTQKLLRELRERPPADLEESVVALASRLQRRPLDRPESKGEEIDYQLRKWRDSLPVLVTGMYKDHDKIKATFQQRFIQLLVASTPSAIEELRALATLFGDFFGSNVEGFHALFEWHRLDDLVDADQALDTVLSTIVYDVFHELSIEFGELVQIRPNKRKAFKYDYKWSQYRTLLLLTVMSDRSISENGSSLFQQALTELEKTIHVDQRVPADIVTGAGLIKWLVGQMFARILERPAANYFAEETRHALTQFSEKSVADAESNVGLLIELLILLLNWAERHSVEKDWALRYAFHFVGEFSRSQAMSLIDLSIPIFGDGQIFSTDYFRFAFDSWEPGNKSREDYEAELREEFNKAVDRFFQLWGRHLNLDRHSLPRGSQITRPIDKDFENVKWLILWNEGATCQQIAAGFNRTQGTVTRGIQSLRDYDLPVRTGARQTHCSPVTEERIAEIKSLDTSIIFTEFNQR